MLPERSGLRSVGLNGKSLSCHLRVLSDCLIVIEHEITCTMEDKNSSEEEEEEGR